jgi:hypothetical protein
VPQRRDLLNDMMLRYQHLTGSIRGDIAGRVGSLLWATEEPVAAPRTVPGEHE